MHFPLCSCDCTEDFCYPHICALQTEHYEAEPALPAPYSGTTWMSQFGSVDRSATNKFGVAELSWNRWGT
jgi:hypothetical protein